MKSTLICCFLSLAWVLAKAQDLSRSTTISTNTELKSMSQGSYTAFTVVIPDASEKLATRQWKELMEEYGAKSKRSKPESVKVEGVAISSIGGANLLDVYADFSERGSEVKTYVWIRQRGVFMSNESSVGDRSAIENLLQGFNVRVRKAAILLELEDEEKRMIKLEKELEKMNSNIQHAERDIERARLTIERAEADILSNQEASKAKQTEIDQQKEALQAVAERLEGVRA